MKINGIGIDIIESDKFKRFKKNPRDRFLTNNYSRLELAHCFSFHDPRLHLAGIFAAKEAVFKTLGKKTPQSAIEVRKNKDGSPEIWIKNTRQRSILVSISHTEKFSIAVAIRQ